MLIIMRINWLKWRVCRLATFNDDCVSVSLFFLNKCIFLAWAVMLFGRRWFGTVFGWIQEGKTRGRKYGIETRMNYSRCLRNQIWIFVRKWYISSENFITRFHGELFAISWKRYPVGNCSTNALAKSNFETLPQFLTTRSNYS